jgi:hypothetical protein
MMAAGRVTGGEFHRKVAFISIITSRLRYDAPDHLRE